MTRLAVAYLRDPEAEVHADSARLLEARHIDLVAVVREEPGFRSNGLVEAMRRIAAGEASVLVVTRLSDLASSLRELVALLNWLQVAGADLVALDVNFDTGVAADLRTVKVLCEVERWERDPESAGRPPRGRPGLATKAPELSSRIAAMRADGLSLQAIANALNADDVPTQRGGTHWRPSSVQAALGYRRPRPPPSGVSPPAPRPDRHPHRPYPPGGPSPPSHRPHKP